MNREYSIHKNQKIAKIKEKPSNGYKLVNKKIMREYLWKITRNYHHLNTIKSINVESGI